MKKLIEMITHNFGWKVLSLAAAILVWFLIVNITNPTRDQSVSVMLRVAGEDVLRENNIVLFNADEIASSIIHLTLRGSYTSLMQAEQDRQNGTLYAFIDLSPIDISRSSDFGSRLPIRV
ncbi:MAG: hypothetical protein FWE68_03395, partial [Defluviitaleaceae bacterium]|nr:hypothetical protein [Defluviitaleaceae bacterium]